VPPETVAVNVTVCPTVGLAGLGETEMLRLAELLKNSAITGAPASLDVRVGSAQLSSNVCTYE